MEAELCCDASTTASTQELEENSTRASANLTVSVLVARFAAAIDCECATDQPIVSAVRMLLASSYGILDVAQVMAVALANVDKMRGVMHEMSPDERIMVAMMHMFTAHSVVLDEFVSLFYWHQWIFAGYCSLPRLNRGVVRIMQMCNFNMLVPSDMFQEKYLYLHGEVCAGADLYSPKSRDGQEGPLCGH